MFSLKAFPELFTSNNDITLSNQIPLNQNLYQTFPFKNKWNYICNSYIFDKKLESNYETKLISNNTSSYSYKHILTKIKNDNYQRDFRKERILIYLKNTNYLIRGNVFKIFVDLNTDLFQQNLFASMFSEELMVRFPNYIIKDYPNFIKSTYLNNFYNQNNYYSTNNNININNEKNWAFNVENFFSKNKISKLYFKNNFDFPNIFQYIDFEYIYESDVLVLQQDIPKNYLDRNIMLNFTNYISILRVNLENFFNKVTFGDFNYLKNFFDITTSLNDNFYLSILDQYSYLVLTNDFTQLESLISSNIETGNFDNSDIYLRNKQNLFYLSKLKSLDTISHLDLFSYNYICVIIKDKFGKTIFQDLRTNAFKNYSPSKILKINSSKFLAESNTLYNQTLGSTNHYSMIKNLNINARSSFDNENILANCFWFNMNLDIYNRTSEKMQNRRNSIFTEKKSQLEIEYIFYSWFGDKQNNITANIQFRKNEDDKDSLFEIILLLSNYSDNKQLYSQAYSLNYYKHYSKIRYNNGWNHVCILTGSEVIQSLNLTTNTTTPLRNLKFYFYLNDLTFNSIQYDITNLTKNYLDSSIDFDYKIKSIYQNLFLSNYKLIIIGASDLNKAFTEAFNTTLVSFNKNYMFNLLRFVNLDSKYDIMINNQNNFMTLTNDILDSNFEEVTVDNFYLGNTNDNNAILDYLKANQTNVNISPNFTFPNGFLLNEFINFNSKSKFVNVFTKGYPYFKYTTNKFVIIIKLDADFVIKTFKKQNNNNLINNLERDRFLIKINETEKSIYFNDAFNEHEFYFENLYQRNLIKFSINFKGIDNPNIVYSYNYSKSFIFYFVSDIFFDYSNTNFDTEYQTRGNYKFIKFDYDYENSEEFSRNFASNEPRCKIENFFGISYNPTYKDEYIENKNIFNPKLIKNATIFDEKNKITLKALNLANFTINEFTTKIKENKFLDLNYFRSDNTPVAIPFNLTNKLLKEGSLNVKPQKVSSSVEINGFLPLIYNPEMNIVSLSKYTNEVFLNLAMIIKYHDYYFSESLSSNRLEMKFKSNLFKDDYNSNQGGVKTLVYNDESQRYTYMASSNIITVKNSKNKITINSKPVFFTIYLNNPDNLNSRRLNFFDNLEILNKEEKRNYNLKVSLVNSYKMYLTYRIELEEKLISGSEEQDIYNNENISYLINFNPDLSILKRDNINFSSKTIYQGSEVNIKVFIEKIKFKNIRWNMKLPVIEKNSESVAYNIEYIFSVNSLLQDIVFSKKEFYSLIQNQIKFMQDNYANDDKLNSIDKILLNAYEMPKIFAAFEIKEFKENIFGLIFKNVPEAYLNIKVFNLNFDISTTIKAYLGNSYRVNPNFYFSSSSRKIEYITSCNRDLPFIWKKSNIRYIEYPGLDLELSVFLNKMTLFLNPVCLSELESNNIGVESYKDQENFVFSSFVKTFFFPNTGKNLSFMHKYIDEKNKRIFSVS